MRIEHLWALGVLAVIFFFLNTHPIFPNDYWWHVRAGQEIVATGAIPTVDTFSHTMAGAPYNNHAAYWLMELALYGSYAAGGPALSVFMHSLLVTAAYALLLWMCYVISASWRIAAAATFFAAVLGYNDWHVRPQTVAFPLFAIVIAAVYGYRRRPRPWLLLLFPATMLVWVNSHGTYVVGLALLGIWLASELWDALRFPRELRASTLRRGVAPAAAALTLALAACLLNPRGVGALAHLMQIGSSPLIRSLIVEWVPPTMGTTAGTLFLIGLLFSAAVLAVSPKRPDAFQLFTFLGFAALGFQASRFAPWFGMAMAPVLADHFAAIGATRPKLASAHSGGSPSLNVAIAGLLLVGCVLSLPWFKGILPLPAGKQPLLSLDTPVAATEWMLREQPPGPIYNDMVFGSYLIWAAPDYPVFADPRIELYPIEIWQDDLTISAARPGWEERLAKYGVNTLMLSPEEQSKLVAAARSSPDWQELYSDRAAVVFGRR